MAAADPLQSFRDRLCAMIEEARSMKHSKEFAHFLALAKEDDWATLITELVRLQSRAPTRDEPGGRQSSDRWRNEVLSRSVMQAFFEEAMTNPEAAAQRGFVVTQSMRGILVLGPDGYFGELLRLVAHGPEIPGHHVDSVYERCCIGARWEIVEALLARGYMPSPRCEQTTRGLLLSVNRAAAAQRIDAMLDTARLQQQMAAHRSERGRDPALDGTRL